MTKNQIKKLVKEFEDASKKHYAATTRNSRYANIQARRINRIFSQIVEIGDDARVELLKLTENENDHVASMAAVYSLKFNPEKSLSALYRVSKKTGLIGFEAEQAIQRWKEGTWQLE